MRSHSSAAAALRKAIFRSTKISILCESSPVDIEIERARKAADFFSVDRPVLATTDFYRAVLSNADTFIINTPNNMHHEQAIAALRENKNILLQKPVASTLDEAVEIARAADLASGISALYMSYFDQPIFYDLRDMIRVGWFGSVTHFYARLMHRGGLNWANEAQNGRKSWRGSLRQTGGGCFIQLAVHHIHLMEWLSGSKITRVQALTKNPHCRGIEGEDFAAAILEFENGVTATIEAAWNAAGEQFSVHGTKGSCEYLNNRFFLAQSENGNFIGRVIRYEPPNDVAADQVTSSGVEQLQEIIPPALDSVQNELNQHRLYLENVRDGVSPFVSVASGVEDMSVVAAVYEAALSQRAVNVDRIVHTDDKTNGDIYRNNDPGPVIIRTAI